MDHILRRKQLIEIIGISYTTLWRMEKAGDFPARIRLGRRAVGWHLDEVEEWLKTRERYQAKGNATAAHTGLPA